MSDLIALCFDADASPSIRFRSATDPQTGLPLRPDASVYGWGVGWYPGSERGASVVKDPTSSGESEIDRALGDWHRFRSTLFVCHLRGHRRPRNQEDAQPFVRSYGGRQWIFAHDGDLRSDYASRFPLDGDPAFEPLGTTDSEHAFCWLLARLHDRHARSLSDVEPEQIRAWLQELNEGGRLNALLADGESLAVYGDAAGQGRLVGSRRVPPHAGSELLDASVRVELDSPVDPNRTALVFRSGPSSDESWVPLRDAELILARRGNVVWQSEPPATLAPRRPTTASPRAVRSTAATQIATAMPAPARTGAAAAPGKRTLRIVHDTHYRYAEPVERSAHRLLLQPVVDVHQRLLESSLEMNPSGVFVPYEDVFGNRATGVELEGPYSELRITSRATVEIDAPLPIEQRMGARRATIPLTWMPWQRQMLAAYLLPPELPESQLSELSEFAMSIARRNGHDLAGTLLDMNDTIYGDFEYVSGSTTVETTPYQVFESRRGVCQDFANLMICLAQLLHVPARYRMGYIHTGADYANQVQSEASHAWVELYVPRAGWCGFDPTNGRQVGGDHVRVACGRHYRDATPTSGTIYRGGAGETLEVTVRVEPVS